MRVLVTAFVPSHFLPVVPLAWALRTAGHEVVVAGMPDIVKAAQEAGLPTAVVGGGSGGFTSQVRPGKVGPDGPAGSAPPPLPAPVRDEAGRPLELSTHDLAAALPWEGMAAKWQLLVGNLIHDYREFAEAWRPDLVLCELDFNGLITGGLLKVPTVLHRWGPELLTSFVAEHARTGLHDLCVGLGLPDGLPAPDLILDPCPPSLQFSGLPAATPYRFVPYNGTGSVPDWVLGPRPGRRIFASLGIFGAQALAQDTRRAFVDGLCRAVEGADDVEVVLPFGEDFRLEGGSLPPYVRLVDPTPLNLVLGTCDLVIHHGGAGTALTATAFGLPQLVLPQPHPAFVGCAERVAATGAGLRLAPDEPAALGDAVRALLEEPGYRQNAAGLAAEMAALPGPGRLVGMLEELASAR